MDVYCGWVEVNFHSQAGSVQRDTADTFLLLNPQDDPSPGKPKIQPYSGNEILAVTITASPSAVGDDDDEANVAAIDSARVVVRSKSFPGIAGTKEYLVLRARVAAHRANVIAFTYQVTLLSLAREIQDPIVVDEDDTP